MVPVSDSVFFVSGFLDFWFLVSVRIRCFWFRRRFLRLNSGFGSGVFCSSLGSGVFGSGFDSYVLNFDFGSGVFGSDF